MTFHVRVAFSILRFPCFSPPIPKVPGSVMRALLFQLFRVMHPGNRRRGFLMPGSNIHERDDNPR
jgi:hypothetical protein